MADGSTLDPAEVASALHSLNRTAEELSDESYLIEQRRSWAVDIDRGPALDKEQARLADAASQLERKFRDDLLKLRERFWPTWKPICL